MAVAGSADTRLVGRRAEISVMRAQLDTLSRGRGGTVLTVGEAGSGKSALLRAVFAGSAHRVIWTAGDELSQVFPLLPFVEAVDGERKAEISGLLRGGAAVSDPAVAASEELVAWVDDLCAVAPVVLVFDDLHWADDASVRLWHRLTRVAEQLPLLVVGSMRPGQDRPELAALARRVRDRGVLVELAPLSREETTELVRELVGGTPSERLSTLVEAAGGNPLYLTELTGALAREGALAERAGVVDTTQDHRPASLTSAISARLDVVPDDVRDLLRVAALLGVEFDVGDLAAASARPVSELVGMLGKAQRAGVITAGMAFRHPLIRDVLCEQVAGSVRAAWHQEVGRALAQAGRPAAAVARQLLAAVEAGGELPPSDWLITWLELEGETLANQSVAVVKVLFAQTLSKLPLTDPQRAAVALPLASALLRANDPAEAERLAIQTLDTRQTNAKTALELGSIIIECRIETARTAEAVEMLDRLESEVDWDPGQRLRLLVARARLAVYLGRFDEADRLAQEALATRLGDQWAMAFARHTLFLAEIYRKDLPAALTHADRGLATIEGDPTTLDLYMFLLADRSFVLIELGRWEESRSNTVRLRQIAVRTGNGRRLRQCVVCDVLRLFLVGEWDDLLSEVEGLEPDATPMLTCFERAAVVCLHRDDTVGAQRFIDNVDRITGRAHWVAGINHEYAEYVRSLRLEHSGDLEGALDKQLDAIANLWSVADVPTAHVVELAMRFGRRADAEKVVVFAEEKAHPRVRDGLIAHCRGALARDPELLTDAARHYRDKQLKLPQAQALETAGLLFAERGDARNARRAMTESLEAYEELGATWDLQRVRAAFREHGLRTGSRQARNRPDSGWQSLTGTETKVANLVAEGMSNRLIAEQLFLSRRTVDTHMSHILAKLGLRSRVEVARMALSQSGR